MVVTFQILRKVKFLKGGNIGPGIRVRLSSYQITDHWVGWCYTITDVRLKLSSRQKWLCSKTWKYIIVNNVSYISINLHKHYNFNLAQVSAYSVHRTYTNIYYSSIWYIIHFLLKYYMSVILTVFKGPAEGRKNSKFVFSVHVWNT